MEDVPGYDYSINERDVWLAKKEKERREMSNYESTATSDKSGWEEDADKPNPFAEVERLQKEQFEA